MALLRVAAVVVVVFTVQIVIPRRTLSKPDPDAIIVGENLVADKHFTVLHCLGLA